MLRVLIIDHEPSSREALRTLLDCYPELQVSECANSAQAVDSVLETNPDLVFLEIEMSEMDGFKIVEAIGAEHMPVTIFMSSRDCYALRAFEARAFDYLLKPVSSERLRSSLLLAKEAIVRRRPHAVASVPGGTLASDAPLIVKTHGKCVFLKYDQIEWVEASGNYLVVHTPTDSYIVRGTMQSIVQKLDPRFFVRIHRSTIVNINCVREIRPWFAGERVVVLRGGEQLNLGRTYREQLNKFMSKVA